MSETILRADTIFHPVGQGGFTTGCLSLSNEPRHLLWPDLPAVPDRFFWAYDCGSDSHQGGLEAEIELLSQRLQRRELGMLVISHFDKDHISGLTALLNRVKVDILLLPYAPLRERILSAFKAGADTEALRFAIDPVSFVAEKGQVNRIVLVPQSDGEGEGGASTVPIGPRPDTPIPETISGTGPKEMEPETAEDLDEYPVQPLSTGPALQILAAQASLSVWALWEFLPYNRRKWLDEANHQKLDIFYAGVDELRDGLLAGPNKKALDDLKNLYDKTFGGKSDPRNRISLALSSAPLPRVQRHRVQYSARLLNEDLDQNPRMESWRWSDPMLARADVVLTGDGSLKLAAFAEFASYYRWRIKGPFGFQVPHHGSKANYHTKLAVTVSPWISVFCAEPTHGPTNHPDFIVHRSFERHQPIIVDGATGIHLCSRHQWH